MLCKLKLAGNTTTSKSDSSSQCYCKSRAPAKPKAEVCSIDARMRIRRTGGGAGRIKSGQITPQAIWHNNSLTRELETS